MSALILDGKQLADDLTQRIAADVATVAGRLGRSPRLTAVQVGENAASKLYTNRQAASCGTVGIEYDLRTLAETAREGELLATLAMINADDATDGVILQMPLPPHFDTRKMQLAIAAEKDVEGIHPINLGRLFYNAAAVAPCTPLAVMELLQLALQALDHHCALGHRSSVGRL